MANGAAGTYFSPQNTGFATVIPTGTEETKFKQLSFLSQLKGREERMRQQRISEQKKQLQQELKDVMDKNITTEFRPYQENIAQLNQELQDKFSNMVMQYGYDIPMDKRLEWEREKNQLERRALSVDSIKKSSEDYLKNIPEDAPIKKNEFLAKFSDLLYDENGNIKDPEDVDLNSIIDQVESDPDIYDAQKVIDKFSESIPEQINNMVDIGSETRTEYEIKSKFYKLKENGEIDFNPDTNQPRYNISPELVNAFKNTSGGGALMSEAVNQFYEQGFEGTKGEAERMALASLIGEKAYRNVTKANIENMPDRGGGSGGGTKEERLALNRKESIRKSIFEGDQSEANRILGGQTFSLGGGVGTRGEKGKITNLKYIGEEQQPFVLSPDQQTGYDSSQTERLPIVEIEYTIPPKDHRDITQKPRKQTTRLNLNKPEDRKRYAQIINEAANSKEGSDVGWDTLMPQFEDLEQGYTPPQRNDDPLEILD